MTANKNGTVLLVEPFYGGSHKQLIDILQEKIVGCSTFTLPAKKWHWRARTSALYFSQTVPLSDTYRVLFASSVLNLAELVALRPDLGRLKKILYFHENQLVYPVRKQLERDFQYGYNQILSCLVADQVVFNSQYNMDSFLSNVSTYMKLIPDHRPTGLVEQIQPKCCVIHFPIRKLTLADKSRECNVHVISKEQENLQEIQDNNQSTITDMDKIGEKSLENIVDSENQTEKQQDSKELHVQGDYSGQKCACFSTDRSTTENLTTQDSHLASAPTCKSSLSYAVDRDTMAAVANLEFGSTRKTFVPPVCHCDDVKAGKYLSTREAGGEKPLHIVWAHRWEHDKNPESFFQVMGRLHEQDFKFCLSVIGEKYDTVPEIFSESREVLKDHIRAWGYQCSKSDYYKILEDADVAVSTAVHEFFGVAMLEAVQSGCYPVCPNRLVYPEIFPKCYLYNTENQLFKKLRQFCKHPHVARQHVIQVETGKFTWSSCGPKYKELLDSA